MTRTCVSPSQAAYSHQMMASLRKMVEERLKKMAQVRHSILARIDAVVTVFKTRRISLGKTFLTICGMGMAALPSSPRRLLRSKWEHEETS